GITVQYRASPVVRAVQAPPPPRATLFPYTTLFRSNTFTAYTSSNGSTWTAVAGSSVTISMSGAVLAGLAVTSHNTGALGTVTFDTGSVAASAPPSSTPRSTPLAPTATPTSTPVGPT